VPVAVDEPDPAIDAATMRRIAQGHVLLRDLVDPERGVVYVLYAEDASGEDPRADDDGIIRLAEHWCAAEELDDHVDRLQRDLHRRIDDPIREPLFECADDHCDHPAQMEYDVEGHYEFARVEGREGPTLIAVEQVEGAAMSEAFQNDAAAFVRDRRAAFATARCP
tara:strand:- start:616 stop:1113 length:498 start_codon:yes stop_codon:yes gene_type:complete